MNSRVILEYQWPYLLSFLPHEEELERTAKENGALSRRRQVQSASVLLRLAFAYGFCGLTLRQTAAWAEMTNIAKISDVALLKRLRASSEWLGRLLGIKLAEKAPPPKINMFKRSLRLVDATTISRPGSKGTDWRVHLGFDLATLKIDYVELTDFTGGETLKRFPLRAGELLIGDRGYAHRAGFYAAIRAKADFLVRLNWQNVPLQQRNGQAFDLIGALRGLDDKVPSDFPVLVAPSPKENIPAIPARLLAVRKSEIAAEDARRKVLHERAKKSQSVDPRTLEAAGYVFVLTSLPESIIVAYEGLDLYRFRWQIELAFKRMKSLLELSHLPAKDPPLARSFIYAKLLAALLLEELTEASLSFSPWGYRLARAPTLAVANSTSPD